MTEHVSAIKHDTPDKQNEMRKDKCTRFLSLTLRLYFSTRGHMVHRQQSSDPNPIPGRKLAMKS